MFHQFGPNDVKRLGEDTCYEGFFSLKRFRFQHRRFDGSWSPELAREIFVRGDATCVLLYDPIKDTIVLVEQFRAGGLLHSDSPWMLELVAGINEAGETPEAVATREAKEEAGANLLDLWHIQDFFPSPGGSTERIHLYLARVDSTHIGGAHGLEEEGEDILAHTIAFADAMQMIKSGQIDNSPAIIAIQWLALNKDEVKQAWKGFD